MGFACEDWSVRIIVINWLGLGYEVYSYVNEYVLVYVVYLLVMFFPNYRIHFENLKVKTLSLKYD